MQRWLIPKPTCRTGYQRLTSHDSVPTVVLRIGSKANLERRFTDPVEIMVMRFVTVGDAGGTGKYDTELVGTYECTLCC